MRLKIYWTCLALLLSTPIFAAGNLYKDLQGEWSRVDHPTRFKVSGNNYTEFAANKPDVQNRQGVIRFRKTHADVTFRGIAGARLKIYSAGQDVLAVESFDAAGAYIGDGTIYYRHGAEKPVGLSPIGKWKLPDQGVKTDLVVTFKEDGTGKASWHPETVLWTQDDDGIVRTIYAHLHRKIIKLKLSEDGREMHDVDNPKSIWKRQ